MCGELLAQRGKADPRFPHLNTSTYDFTVAIDVRNKAHTSYTILLLQQGNHTTFLSSGALDDRRLFHGLRLLLLPRPAQRCPKCLCPDT